MVDIMQTAALKKKYQFPVRKGNSFKLLIDGDEYFSRMLAAIGEAQGFILLEQYLVTSGQITDRFVEQLCRAAARHVAVYLLLDDFGATGLAQYDRHQLVQAGVRLCFFNPVRFKHFFHSLFRDHRKSLVVDGRIAFIGGAGLTDEFSTDTIGSQAWHDVMLEIQGEVVQDWCRLFVQTWLKHSSHPIHTPPVIGPSPAGTQAGRLLASAPFRRQEINRALIKHLRRARQRAWITSPYFIPPRKIRRILRQAARRGVDVRLLLPGRFSDHPWISFAARRHYLRMLKSGVRIFEYQPRFTHAKMELCDDWVSIGSSNLDRWNQHWNLDANQSIYDKAFARRVSELFLGDFADSAEITLAGWQQRPWLTRFREGLSGQVVYWLERLIRFYR